MAASTNSSLATIQFPWSVELQDALQVSDEHLALFRWWRETVSASVLEQARALSPPA
jgi:hypothetical protein